MALIIPGVQVQVVKEVLPQQLAPSGVLGLIGFTETGGNKVARASSWSRFVEVFGAASAYSLPEARQALDNGVFELVISPLSGGKAATAKTHASPKKRLLVIAKAAADKAAEAKATADKAAEAKAKDAADKAAEAKAAADDAHKAQDTADKAPDKDTNAVGLSLVARAPGLWGNQLSVKVKYRDNVDGAVSFDLSIKRPGGDETGWETFRDVRLDTLAATLERSALAAPEKNKTQDWPAEGETEFRGGEDASPDDYTSALERLKDQPDVDMVLAAVQDTSSDLRLTQIYGSVISHCNMMSADCKGRIGFGQVRSSDVAAATKLASNLVSDRFVLVTPFGVAGAVAGKVGSLPYFHSPTFKVVSGLSALAPIAVEEQRALLTGYVVPVVLERGKGVIVLRGLTTDGDQISVRRVADHAVRVMKAVGDRFIGLLNNADGRSALKQRLVAELLQMEKDGAIVPSTDGKDPAFEVEVYSSQKDFAEGIVRVNMAVRPVRAIDYIYATITIQI